ncbi:MAG TPA: winged helix-turn-helix transcriptional regulator [Nitrososphaera sp.]|jgi:small subunit ribosomal protein S25e|nr:winged helix-turn-helix transcriptional regulator [Nitrososphaera sp.]
MGGNKKKPSEKGGQTGPGGAEIKPADDKKKTPKPQQKQKLAVVVEENAGMKAIQGMKSITSQALARNVGVKISVANSFIKSLEAKGVVKPVGGYSGHRVYQVIKQ